ncbi:ABC transporter permease [Actinoplanes derwentensis]|uniref:Putative ABC transport system permease protein n=1 Tax=Actinoplanes derwentensis TaxID=113562 RepID=A0A1H1RLF2_9ACTN|nr:ABC transporter permease [Actinoplanes derwentensis]GID84440.1 ABC transporter permease [Actinoplanes derwentensis]SDS35789.1 putative ABC transport system permease protein [Actinoplanes derwentensis]
MKAVRLSLLDLLSLGLVGLRVRRARAVLSALGIAIGIATTVVVMGIPASSEQALMRELERLGTDLLQASSLPDQDPPVALDSHAAEMARRIGPVTGAAAMANTRATIARNERTDNSAATTVLATQPGILELLGGTVRTGRWFDVTTETFPAVVLGAEAAERLGVVDTAGGPQIYIGRRWFTVTGVLAPIPLAPEIDRSALVGWPAAERELGFDGLPTVLYVRGHDAAVETVREVLPATVLPSRPGMVRVTRPSDALAAKRASENTFSALFLGMAGVALLVGAVGVANTMVISVLERRREIGLRRALGAHRGQIRAQFLTESAVLSLFGGLTGTLIGVAVTVGYALHQNWPPVIPPAALGAGTGGALLIGMLAGVYPSMRAARLTPTEALASS